jgi:glycosyltransferase involved in cell wall biosynthesis
MRVAFISSMSVIPWGGSEELWSQTASRLAAAGHRLAASVAYWPKLPSKVTALRNQGIDVFVRRPLRVPLHGRFWRALIRWRPERECLSWLRRVRPDLVVISQGSINDGFEFARACMRAGVPYIIVVNANAEWLWPSDDVADDFAATFHQARMVFFVSERNRELLQCQIGETLRNAAIVRSPYSVSKKLPPAWPEQNGAYKLACVGRLEMLQKGQDLLLKVLSQPEWRGRSVELDLYGHGACERGIRRLVATLGLTNVHFKGFANNVASIWESNHILVLPSRSEGTPISLVDAMLCARPAVVTDVGGMAELCVDGKTGFVAAAPTPGLLGEAMERAWARRSEWQDIGTAARARANQLIPDDPAGVFADTVLAVGK